MVSHRLYSQLIHKPHGVVAGAPFMPVHSTMNVALCVTSFPTIGVTEFSHLIPCINMTEAQLATSLELLNRQRLSGKVKLNCCFQPTS